MCKVRMRSRKSGSAWAVVAGWLVLCCAVGSHGAVSAQSGTAADRIREMERSVVRIIARGPGGSSTGTGSVVARGFALTNQHVVDGGQEFMVVSAHTGGMLPARVRWESSDLDLAVVRIEGLTLPAVTLGTMGLRAGDDVWALGYPGASDLVTGDPTLDLTWSRGVISRLFRGPWLPQSGARELDKIQHTSPINRGNSGGPLLSDCGVVVGVNTQGYDRDSQGRDLHNIFLASRITEAVRELRRLSVQIEVADTRCSQAEAGAGSAEANSVAQEAATRAEEAVSTAGQAVATAEGAAVTATEAKNQSESAIEKLGQVYWLMLALASVVLPTLVVLIFRKPREQVARVVERASVKVRNWRPPTQHVRAATSPRYGARQVSHRSGGNPGLTLRLVSTGPNLGSQAGGIVIGAPDLKPSAGGFVLGSHPALTDQVLDHPTVSRRHARVVRDGQRFFIEDLNSSNGTQVDGAEIEPFSLREISPGCTIRLGGMPVLHARSHR